MTATACALLGFVAWSILLSFTLVFTRVAAISKGKALNTFKPSGEDLDDFGYRMTRSHGNSIENLAIIASLLLYALVTQQTSVTDGLAVVVFGARVVQSVIHVISTSLPAVMIRATAFSVQLGIGCYWIWQFWHLGAAA